MRHSMSQELESPSSTEMDSQLSRSREKRIQDTALHHARLLQQRKEMENLIVASTESLLDVPATPSADPARPSPSDASFVKRLLGPFQPSDYDNLVEERNINGKCGYVLCPRPKRIQDSNAKFRILRGSTNNPNALKFVSKENLEMWCSDTCGKRALYIKVQLIDEPAWTRAAPFGEGIQLLEEDEGASEGEVGPQSQISNLDNQKKDRLSEKMKNLAIERGDCDASDVTHRLRNFNISETVHADELQDSSITSIGGSSDGTSGSIEGYTPKFPDQRWEGDG